MEFTTIPHLKMKVSRVGFGSWAIGGWMWGGTDEREAIASIHKALDHGVNLIDTAPVYGFGMSEKIVGKALKLYGKRDQMAIATKAGLGWDDGKLFRDSRKETILKEVDASLKRLQIDYIDLYQIHWPDPLVPFNETAEAMLKLLKEGKIRSIGVSNYSIEQMESFQKGAALHALQSPFNMFERKIEEKELAYCLKKKIAVLGYGSLCRGLLSGTMSKTRKFKGDDLRKVDPKFQEPRFSQYLKCADSLEKWVENKHQRPLMALAIRWALDKGVNVALWGARKPDQLEGIGSFWGWKLTSKDFDEIDQIMEDTIKSPVGPEFMAPPSREIGARKKSA